ncbi:MAG: AarF/ABC1/UbiB kinase family protein [Acidobacteriota bacterium]|nr:AarF/ABC1/UbiB kinase family protein [Blastocatellia bacterium]MDW8411480.1 AarF/ABC1/UbiB kinase family protein [Acidobacteriota bacterium]
MFELGPQKKQNQQLLPAGTEKACIQPYKATYLAESKLSDYGLKGLSRAALIYYSVLSFGLKLYLDRIASQKIEDLEGLLPRLLHKLALLSALRSKPAALREARGKELTERLMRLGTTFIKIGQTLSTRPDLLPNEYLQQLSLLQDQVKPFPTRIAYKIIAEELGRSLEEVFSVISESPVAAASLGQVYEARLKNGERVAVKVQRPGLENIVNADLAVIRLTLERIERSRPKWLAGIEWQPILQEFASMLFKEMDYLQEAENAETFRKNFADWPQIYVPKVYHEYCSQRVLVEEYIDGFKVNDPQALQNAGFDPMQIVKLCSKAYLKQLLEDGFFHADPHPGNLRVMRDGRLAFFDFGMVGQLPTETQSLLVDCFFHIVERDVHGLVDDLIALKFLKEGADPQEFRPAIEEIFSHYIGIKLGQIKFRQLIDAISETIYKLPFTFPADITFVTRALTTIEGLGLLVDPSFSFFDTIKPYAKEFMLKREGRHLRDKLLARLTRGEDGRISWNKVWKLAKMAIKFYLSPNART